MSLVGPRLWCYIWERVCGVTQGEHDAGGLVVIAPSIDHARGLLRAMVRPNGVASECGAFTDPPTVAFPLSEAAVAEVRVFVFPDEGCCG